MEIFKPGDETIKTILTMKNLSDWRINTKLVDLYVSWANALDMKVHSEENQRLFTEHIRAWKTKYLGTKWAPKLKRTKDRP